jgi:hypothetical protein
LFLDEQLCFAIRFARVRTFTFVNEKALLGALGAFIATAHDPRIQVAAFNRESSPYGH